MAQNIILKRSALPGKVPDTGSLNLGEIALNTYDGRAFIHKSGSTESIEQIVVTNSVTTGSINITQTGSFGEIDVTNDINVSGSIYVTNDIVANGDLDVLGAVSASVVSASVFYGDGSNLTGVSTSGGTTDSEIPTNDWDYNVEGTGSLSDGNNVSTKYTIDFQAESYGVRPVGYQTFISNNDGSTEIIPGTDGVVFIVNNQEVGRIDEGGIIGNTPLGTISSSAQIAALGYVTSSSGGGSTDISALNTFTASADVSISNLNTFTASVTTASLVTSITNLNSYTASQSTASLVDRLNVIESVSGSWITESETGSFEIKGIGIVSGSSQLTSSFETIGRGIVSGSSQITGTVNLTNLSATSQVSASVFVGGFGVTDAKFTVIQSKAMTFWPNITYELVRMTTGGGVLIGRNGETNDYGLRLDVSGSTRFTGNMIITGSLLTSSGITGSIAATNGVISGSSQLTNLNTTTASLLIETANLETFSASVLTRLTTIGTYTSSLNTWTSSVATTGSNSFNGNQTITGSLTVSSVAVVSASVTLPSGSVLSLTSGSSLLVQNSGLAEITGSLVVSGSTTINNYRIDDAWTSYSVTWTSDGTSPTLNNGTLTGYYKLIGKTCFLRVKLVIGSTSSVGTGAWQFTLPFTAASADGVQFPCSMLDNTVAWYAGVVNGTYSGNTTKSAILCTTSGTHAFGAVSPTTPFTWGTGDSLMFNGSYEIA